MTSQRTHFGGREGPGPGEYEPFSESQMKVEHYNIQPEENKRYDARLPRYHEWVVQREEKKVLQMIHSLGRNFLKRIQNDWSIGFIMDILHSHGYIGLEYIHGFVNDFLVWK